MTQTLLIDCAWSKPSPSAVKAAGYKGVIGYISHDTGKDLDAEQAGKYVEAGLAVGFVFETTATRSAEGENAGAEDCRYAENEARKRGYPTGCPIFYAVDFDAHPSQVLGYFRGVKAAAKRYGWGPYGSARVVAKVGKKLRPTATWQTVAWSGGVLAPRADLYQRATRSHAIKGVARTSFDEDVLIRDVPLWVAGDKPGPDPHPPAQPKEPKVNAIKKYAKAHTALVGAVGTWLSVALKDGHIDNTEWYGLVVAAATALGVYAVPNKKRKTAKK